MMDLAGNCKLAAGSWDLYATFKLRLRVYHRRKRLPTQRKIKGR